MKIIITENQFVSLIEQTTQLYSFFSLLDRTVREVFEDIKSGNKIKFYKIKPMQYKQALMEFMKYKEFFRFPVKYIYKWKDMMLENVALLDALTSIHGHTQYFPEDEFYDIFDNSESYISKQYNMFTNDLSEVTPQGEYTTWAKTMYAETGNKDYLKSSWNEFYEFLDEVYKIDNVVPFFNNGQPVLTDYGLQPLLDLSEILITQDDPGEIIITINKMLDISHQRSDLAELFIEGGSKSLDFISNN